MSKPVRLFFFFTMHFYILLPFADRQVLGKITGRAMVSDVIRITILSETETVLTKVQIRATAHP